MAIYRKGPLAISDMRAIGRYTQKHWGQEQRKNYLARLAQQFEYLAEQPARGKSCDEIRAGYRKYPEGKHIIFYRIANDDVVEIVRVLHERMDYKLHLVL